ncbi:MAG: hypothetical protein U9Q20_00840 [Campylobacterota bacterium]|nr:hypothetical protein [Campylobacterota bacterium]
MSTITINKECGCFKRSAYENNMKFDSKDEALIQGKLMLDHMNTKFCGKHGFELSENGEDFLITMGQPVEKSGCCGGGHCS